MRTALISLGLAATASAQPIPDNPATLVDPLVTLAYRSGSYTLDDEDRAALEAAVSWARENPLRLLVVEGHASPLGGRRSNMRLSQLRMERVRDELIRIGASPAQVIGVAYGELDPDADPRDRPRVIVRGTLETYEQLIRAQAPEPPAPNAPSAPDEPNNAPIDVRPEPPMQPAPQPNT